MPARFIVQVRMSLATRAAPDRFMVRGGVAVGSFPPASAAGVNVPGQSAVFNNAKEDNAGNGLGSMKRRRHCQELRRGEEIRLFEIYIIKNFL